jgi:hypothetical protein
MGKNILESKLGRCSKGFFLHDTLFCRGNERFDVENQVAENRVVENRVVENRVAENQVAEVTYCRKYKMSKSQILQYVFLQLGFRQKTYYRFCVVRHCQTKIEWMLGNCVVHYV